jgi:hypothetical protein
MSLGELCFIAGVSEASRARAEKIIDHWGGGKSRVSHFLDSP